MEYLLQVTMYFQTITTERHIKLSMDRSVCVRVEVFACPSRG